MRLAIRAAWTLAFGSLLALLPSPERERVARETGLDAPRCSLLFGLAQGSLGLALYVLGGLAFMRASATGASMGLLEQWQDGLTTTHFRGAGMLGWLVWLVVPLSWPWAYLALVGLTRVCAFAITREAVGEPVFVVLLRAVQTARRKAGARRRLRAFGPERPDEVSRSGEGWLVIASRPRSEWNEQTTVEIEGRHFRVERIDEVSRGAWRAVAYRLEPQPDHAIVRRLARYDPPRERPGREGENRPDG